MTDRTLLRSGLKFLESSIEILKSDSYVFVDEVSQHLLALIERVGSSEVTVLMNVLYRFG